MDAAPLLAKNGAMKLVTFLRESGPEPSEERAGALLPGGWVLEFDRAIPACRGTSVLELLRHGDTLLPLVADVVARAVSTRPEALVPLSEVELLAPIPRPVSVRDGYAFRQHVETVRRNRGLPMIEEFDRFPVFYFSNHLAVVGPGRVPIGRRRLEQLDYELECFCVIGRRVINPTIAEADDAIVGYGVLNDLSARSLQMEEMKLSLGPAKGKDFATAIGPWLVTKDELGDRLEPTRRGNVFHARMTAHVGGELLSDGNVDQMRWTFAEIVQRAADGVMLEPGEVIGSGTVGTGCLLELNGSGVTKDRWLRPGDVVSLSIEGLGTLVNTIVEDPGR
jgi:fumarylacetoacetate (FAA) hydrolase